MKKIKKKDHRLLRKFYFQIASVVAGTIVLLGTIIMVIIAVRWWNEKVDSLKENATYLAGIVLDADYRNADNHTISSLSKTIGVISNASESDFYIVDKDGKIVICNESSRSGSCKKHSKITIEKDLMDLALDNGFSRYNTTSDFGFGMFILATPIDKNDKSLGAVFAVEDAVSGLLPYIFSIVRFVFYAMIFALVLSFIIIYYRCRSITEPISELKEATRHFAKGEFSYKTSEDYKDSFLNEFSHSLNKMARELKVEDEAQKSFVANVSHELKTPMTSIGGFIDGILDGTIPREKEREYLTIVSNEVKRLSRMVVSMLNLSKIESGEVGLSPITYDVSSRIFSTLLLFETKINEKHVNVEGFEEMGTVKIDADKDLLQRVIYNLFDNAVKFVDENGTLSVFAKEDENGTEVRIRNSGKGISEEERVRVFERFYKVDKSRSYDVKGVGLGLYIVKTIVNMHDGEIGVASEEGKYTEFYFTIPKKTD